MDQKHVDMAIRQALSRATHGKGDACPDQNLLAAYLEHRLGVTENQALEVHLSECTSCQGLLAMAMDIGEEAAPETALQDSSPKRVLFRLSIPVSSLILIVIAVAAGVLFLRTSKQPSEVAQPIQTAEIHEPVPATPPAPAVVPKELPRPARPQKRLPPPDRYGAAVNEAEVKEARSGPPPQESPALPASQTADRTVPVEIAGLRAKSEVQAHAAATGYAQIRDGKVSPDYFAQAKEVPGGVVGGAVGGILGGAVAPRTSAIHKTAALETVLPTPRDAILAAGAKAEETTASRWKKVGDRGFRFASGYWVDEQCVKDTGKTIVEVGEGAPDFEEILKSYPELLTLRPVIILWKDKILVLK